MQVVLKRYCCYYYLLLLIIIYYYSHVYISFLTCNVLGITSREICNCIYKIWLFAIQVVL